MLKIVITLIGLLVVTITAAPTSPDYTATEQKSIFEDAFDVYSSCSGESSLSVCLKLQALRYVDRVARSADINVFDGFKIVQTDDAHDSRADNGRSLNDIESSLPEEIEAKESAINEALIDRTSRFLSTHTVELSLPEEVSRAFGEARGKKKKAKKLFKSLAGALLLLKIKFAALLPLILGGLALLALKAFVLGKLAFIISSIILLQKILSKVPQRSYEVVAHAVPSHEDHHEYSDHHGGGWARSAGSDLAYSAYKPAE